MIPLLLAAALCVVWWPVTRTEHRLGNLRGAKARRASMPARVVAVVALPVGLAVGAGVAAALSAALVAAGLLWQWHRTRRVRRRDQETTDLLLALSVMIAELSVGAPPAHACAAAARELHSSHGPSGAVAGGLTAMSGRAELGGDVLDRAPAGQPDLGDDASWRRIAVAWQMADRHGLPMIELLESVRSDLLERRQFAARTHAGLAGPRATAAVLAGLPVIGVLLGQLMGAEPLTVLLGSDLGGILLVVGTAMAMAGWMWAQRITDRAARR
ncbi:MAG: type II secretion system protein F [Actinomycetota bacterium]|nr:type II secretion system protein F [Actinomycetota bacterium]